MEKEVVRKLFIIGYVLASIAAFFIIVAITKVDRLILAGIITIGFTGIKVEFEIFWQIITHLRKEDRI